jgi:palmitoyltransferase ZDHHC4
MRYPLSYLLIAFIVYIIVIGFIIYYCVFANVETSSLAKICKVTIPQYIYQTIESIFGIRILNIFDIFIVQHFFVIIYLCIVLGCWSIIFTYIYPWITQQHIYYMTNHITTTTTSSTTTTPTSTMIVVSIYHQYIGIFVFLCCLISWRVTNKSLPGIIVPNTIQYYNHYPYDYIMYYPMMTNRDNNNDESNNNHHHSNERQNMNTTTTTTTTKLLFNCKLPRSKYDRMKYNAYIAKYDHYCNWVHNTIGENNYQYFLLFLFIHVLMCYYGTIICSILFYNEIYIIHQYHLRSFYNPISNKEIQFTYTILFQYLMTIYLYEMIVYIVVIVMSITLTIFLLYHIYITSIGFTSNEVYKWSQVQQWYKNELQLYNQQQKQLSSTKIQIPKQEIIEHPGPKPINLYNYGILQNWKDVFDPKSIQKQKQQQKQQPPRNTSTTTITTTTTTTTTKKMRMQQELQKTK